MALRRGGSTRRAPPGRQMGENQKKLFLPPCFLVIFRGSRGRNRSSGLPMWFRTFCFHPRVLRRAEVVLHTGVQGRGLRLQRDQAVRAGSRLLPISMPASQCSDSILPAEAKSLAAAVGRWTPRLRKLFWAIPLEAHRGNPTDDTVNSRTATNTPADPIGRQRRRLHRAPLASNAVIDETRPVIFKRLDMLDAAYHEWRRASHFNVEKVYARAKGDFFGLAAEYLPEMIIIARKTLMTRDWRDAVGMSVTPGAARGSRPRLAGERSPR